MVHPVTALAQSVVGFCITEPALCSATLARSIPRSALELHYNTAIQFEELAAVTPSNF